MELEEAYRILDDMELYYYGIKGDEKKAIETILIFLRDKFDKA